MLTVFDEVGRGHYQRAMAAAPTDRQLRAVAMKDGMPLIQGQCSADSVVRARGGGWGWVAVVYRTDRVRRH